MTTPSRKIYYTAVTRGQTILVEYTEQKGNTFRNFTQDILRKIKPGQAILEYDGCDYFVDKDKNTDLIYLVCVEKGFSNQVGFEMLSKMRMRFNSLVDSRVIPSAKAFGLNPDFQNELKILHVE